MNKKELEAAMEYRLYIYDVWGDEEECWVNDIYETTTIIEIPESGEIMDILMKELFEDGTKKEDVEINDDEEVIYVDYQGKPLCELRKEVLHV